MASQGKAEFVLGEIFTFSGMVDAAIGIIDHYSRWEVLVNLQEHVPFLAHPATPIILLTIGLILINRSVRAAIAEEVTRVQSSDLRDEHGNRIPSAIKVPSLRATYVVIFIGAVTACLVCVLWLLSYSPLPRPLTRNIPVPVICKTADCWPKPAHISKPLRNSQLIFQGNSGGVNVQQVTTGEHSPIINSPITVGSVSRRISADDQTKIKAYLQSANVELSGIRLRITVDQYSRSEFVDDFFALFKNSNWPMADDRVQDGLFLPIQFQGAVICVKGDPLKDGEQITFTAPDPKLYIGNILNYLSIPVRVLRGQDIPEGVVMVQFREGIPKN